MKEKLSKLKDFPKKEVIKEKDIKNKKIEKPQVDVNVSTINDQPALYVYPDETDTQYILKHYSGWRQVPDFFAFHVRNYKGLIGLMEKLNKQFTINQSKLNDIITIGNKLKSGKGRLLQSAPLNVSDVRNFFRIQHRMIPISKGGKKQEIRPWILIWDKEVYICFNVHTHPSKVINQFKRIKNGLSGVASASEYDGVLVRFYKNKKEAAKDLEELENYYKVANKKDAINEINTMKLFSKRPNTQI